MAWSSTLVCEAQLSWQWSEVPHFLYLKGHVLHSSESLDKCIQTSDKLSGNSQWAYPGVLCLYRHVYSCHMCRYLEHSTLPGMIEVVSFFF